MDINTVKEIVSRYYDHHDSKYVFGGRKSNVDYFYNTERWDWYFDYWTSLESDFFKKRSGHDRRLRGEKHDQC